MSADEGSLNPFLTTERTVATLHPASILGGNSFGFCAGLAMKLPIGDLREQGMAIDLDMTRLAILVYSKRNILCNTGIGDAAASSSDDQRNRVGQAKAPRGPAKRSVPLL